MGKRIRWIWVISLSAALAAIGVQGYWLFNQFRYEMCTYADEIAGEVFHAGQEEFRIRKEEAEMTKGTYIIERQSKYQSGDSVLNGLKNSFGFQLYPKDTTKIHSFRLHLDPNMPEDSLLVGVDRSVVEFFVPFSAERLDSCKSGSAQSHRGYTGAGSPQAVFHVPQSGYRGFPYDTVLLQPPAPQGRHLR